MQRVSINKNQIRIIRKSKLSDRILFLILLHFLNESESKSHEVETNNQINKPETSNQIVKKQVKKERNNRLKYLIFWGLFLALFFHSFGKFGILNQTIGLIIPKAQAQVPYIKSPSGFIPDWSRMKFSEMIIQDNGSITYQGSKGAETRTWTTGQSIAEFLELGDFEESNLNLEGLDLSTIAQIQGIDLNSLNLSDFQLVNWQSLSSLAEAIPDFKDKLISEVKIVSDLIQQEFFGEYTTTIGDLIEQYPEFAATKLNKLVDLSKYGITDIPGIEQAQIGGFENWQDSKINGVPGLPTLTWDNLPGLNALDLSFIAKVDIVYKEVEANRVRAISGSYQEGFNVPCLQTNCAHAEMSGIGSTTGTQWISGKYQEVSGGFGLLKSLNGGKEPTGRNPFGSAFKQVVWNIDEASGTMETAMFFRICKTFLFIGRTCSPYFIGTVPFIKYREKDPIILGLPASLP